MYRRLDGPRGRSERVGKNLAPTGIRNPDHPRRSESLCRPRMLKRTPLNLYQTTRRHIAKDNYYTHGRENEFASLPAHTYSLWVAPVIVANKETVSNSWRLKRPRREADHPSQSSSKVKNEWSYTSIPPTCFFKHSDNYQKACRSSCTADTLYPELRCRRHR